MNENDSGTGWSILGSDSEEEMEYKADYVSHLYTLQQNNGYVDLKCSDRRTTKERHIQGVHIATVQASTSKCVFNPKSQPPKSVASILGSVK
jgi:hypothetical protein